MQVVVERVPFAEELGAEEELALWVALGELLGVAHGHRGLDDHDGPRVHLEHQLDHLLHEARVEEVLVGVVVGGRGDDDELRLPVGLRAVEGGGEVQLVVREVVLDLHIRDGRQAPVDEVDLPGDDVHGGHMVALGQQDGQGKPHVAGAGNGDVHCISPSLYRIAVIRRSTSHGSLFYAIDLAFSEPLCKSRVFAQLHGATAR